MIRDENIGSYKKVIHVITTCFYFRLNHKLQRGPMPVATFLFYNKFLILRGFYLESFHFGLMETYICALTPYNSSYASLVTRRGLGALIIVANYIFITSLINNLQLTKLIQPTVPHSHSQVAIFDNCILAHS